jgi:hypothetical protein
MSKLIEKLKNAERERQAAMGTDAEPRLGDRSPRLDAQAQEERRPVQRPWLWALGGAAVAAAAVVLLYPGTTSRPLIADAPMKLKLDYSLRQKP